MIGVPRIDLSRLAASASRHLVPIVAAGVVLAVVALAGVPLAIASRPAYFARYHWLARNYGRLEASAHKGLACTDCHVDPRGSGVHDLALIGDFYASLLARRSTPTFVKFAPPRSTACLRCHRNDWSDASARTSRVPHPAHLRVATETRDCVKCHKWTAHEEITMQKHKKMPFSGVCVAYGCHVGTKKTAECTNCHHRLNETDQQWKTDHPNVVRAVGPNGCLETCHDANQCRTCHTTGKTPTFNGLATETGLETIETEHVKSTWPRQHGAFALTDRAQCMKCHVSDTQCRECHSQRPAFHGSTSSWIGTHKNVAKKVTDPRCLECHRKPWCDACHRQFKEMR